MLRSQGQDILARGAVACTMQLFLLMPKFQFSVNLQSVSKKPRRLDFPENSVGSQTVSVSVIVTQLQHTSLSHFLTLAQKRRYINGECLD